MVKSISSITSRLLLVALVLGAVPVWAQTTTIRGATKGTSTAQSVTSTSVDSNHTALDVNIASGGGSGGTASNFGSAFPSTGTAAGFKDSGGTLMQPGNLDSSGRLIVNCGSGCAGAAGDGTGSGALGALNNAVSIALSTYGGVEVNFTSGGSLVGTVTPEISFDGGTSWVAGAFTDPISGVVSLTLTNPTSGNYGFMFPTAVSHVRVRVSAYTSGTTTANVRTTALAIPQVIYGTDGTNVRGISTNSSGRLQVDVISGGGSNASVSTIGAAVPGSATYTGFNDGSNLVGVRSFDTDSGGGTQNTLGVSLRKTASGGSVEAGTSSDPLRVDPTGATTQPVSGTVTANIGTSGSLALDATLTGGTQKAIVRGGAKGTTSAADVTSTASGANHNILDVAIYDASGNQITSFGGSGGTASNFGSAFPSAGTAAGFTDGTNMVGGRVVTSTPGSSDAGLVVRNINPNLAADNSTNSSSKVPVLAGVATTSAPTYTTTNQVPLSLQTDGSLRSAITNNVIVTQGTGTNLHVVCDSGCSSSAGFADNSAFTFGTTAINPIGGVLDDTATNTATENSAAVARITAQKALHTNLRNNSGTEIGTSGTPIRTDPTGTTTQPVSIAGNQSVNVAQINGVTPLMGNGVTGTGSQRVTIASDNTAFSVNAVQSGTWTVQPGNTANTTPWLIRPSDGTNNVNVKAASTAAIATDPALVVAVSPNNTIPVNTTQFGGTNLSTGTGAGGAGIPRVTISNDSALAANQSVNVNQIGGTGVTVAADNSTNSSAKLPVLAARANTSAPTWTDGLQVPLSVDTAGNLRVNSTGGGAADGTAFTESTTTFSATGGLYKSTPLAPLISGSEYAAQITGQRALHQNLRSSVGTELGTVQAPLIVAMAPYQLAAAAPGRFPTIPQNSKLLGTLNQPIGSIGDRLKVDPTPLGDACTGAKKADSPISQTATTSVVPGKPGLRIYVCSIRVVAAVAEIVSQWEGTGTNCGTGTIAHSGSTTTANGESLAANGGYVEGGGGATIATTLPGNDYCLAQNTSSRVSGKISYIYAP